AHLINPRDVVPESIMPSYPWLEENELSDPLIQDKMRALMVVGTPYTEDDVANAPAALEGKKEIDALITYLQSLGTKVKVRR
ncbi:MAG: cbb3-type cytochrome c oxidase subunit II, partial [Gammaproteobacteria bacterium]|nr:cbb3-type cytochrome c oxidase subunit II [Gammaproteobacteria bacterium]